VPTASKQLLIPFDVNAEIPHTVSDASPVTLILQSEMKEEEARIPHKAFSEEKSALQ